MSRKLKLSLLVDKGRMNISIAILLLFNLLLFLALSLLSPTFLTVRNLSALMLRMSELAMLTIAQALVMINGGMDLTVGSVMALSGAVSALLFDAGMGTLVAIVGALMSGIVIGLFNSFLIVGLGIQSFIATVAVNSIVRSIVYLLLKGNVLSSFPRAYVAFGNSEILGVPSLFLIVFVFAGICTFILKKTALGRSIYYVGANEKCAFLSGIKVKSVRVFVLTTSGILAAIAGIMYTARLGAIIPDAGLNSPLEVVTAVLIGGASVRGGKGSILGSLLGICAMFMLINGFSLLGMNPFWEVVLLGVILIAIVGRSNMKKKVKKS